MKKVLIIFLILIISFFLLIKVVFDTKTNKNIIINKYKDNTELFEKTVVELTKDILFSRENLGWKYGEIQVDERKREQYPETIKLMESLNIIKISKTGKNVIFQIHTTIGLSQNIVKLEDEEKFTWSGYKTHYKENLGNNWYYIETK